MEALLYFICWGNQLLNIINSMQTNLTERVFGLPSVPRESLPSMFQILGWYPQQQIIETDNKPNEPEKIEVNQVVNVIQNPKQTVVETIDIKKDVGSPSRKRISKSMTKSGIYQIPDIKLKREYSLQKCQTVGTKIESSRKIIAKKILDPNNTEDVKQIEARKKRIKDFMYVTRDLPNSALTTYEGKPTWQVYGRANSNSNLLSHNVMPHRGQNHPKTLQSYFNALMKGKKLSQSTYVPKKPIQEIKQPVKQEHIEPINLPLQKPDLINHVRFTAINNREKKQNKIPTNKVTPLQKKNASKTAQKLKKKKQTIKKVQIDDDGLKFMNTRQNLLELLERKKTASSKLAWKITECYPFELGNQQKLKQTVEEWKHQRMAGKQSVRQESVGQLLKFSKQSPL